MKKNITIKDLIIRDCDLLDYQFISNLSKKNMEEYTKECWGGWDSKRFKANLKKENIKIINYNKKRIGFFDVTRDDKASYLHNIQIVNLFQGKGIGAKIMEEIEISEKMIGMKKIGAQVFKKNPARFFYRKLGYKTVKRGPYTLTIEKNL